jgi:hypothetical protein
MLIVGVISQCKLNYADHKDVAVVNLRNLINGFTAEIFVETRLAELMNRDMQHHCWTLL